jgi:ankyrin repeat protein
LKQHINAGTERMPPLHIACLYGQLEAVKLLVLNGAHLNDTDFRGNNALGAALDEMNNTEGIKFLLDHGADVNLQGIDGDTPLHTAFRFHNRESIEVLIEYGADIHIRNQKDSCSNIGFIR